MGGENKLKKKDLHESYKKILAITLSDFYVEASNCEPGIQTLQDLKEFIDKFLQERIKAPREDWNPGDQ